MRTAVWRWLGVCVLAGGLGWSAPAQAHECVDGNIIHAPDEAWAGRSMAVAAEITDCGEPTRGIRVGWGLRTESGRIIPIGRDAVRVRSGDTLEKRYELTVPADLRPGRYTLVLRVQTAGGATDADRARLFIH